MPSYLFMPEYKLCIFKMYTNLEIKLVGFAVGVCVTAGLVLRTLLSISIFSPKMNTIRVFKKMYCHF